MQYVIVRTIDINDLLMQVNLKRKLNGTNSNIFFLKLDQEYDIFFLKLDQEYVETCPICQKNDLILLLFQARKKFRNIFWFGRVTCDVEVWSTQVFFSNPTYILRASIKSLKLCIACKHKVMEAEESEHSSNSNSVLD